jgi:hypothetical protein
MDGNTTEEEQRMQKGKQTTEMTPIGGRPALAAGEERDLEVLFGRD